LYGSIFVAKRKDEQAHGEYRTKRVILDIYDAMQQAVETDTPYHMRLDPPPAHGWPPPQSPLEAVMGHRIGSGSASIAFQEHRMSGCEGKQYVSNMEVPVRRAVMQCYTRQYTLKLQPLAASVLLH